MNENYVLTAAHCVYEDRQYTVGFGNYNDKIRMFDAGRISVKNKFIHPSYNKASFLSDDLAILGR